MYTQLPTSQNFLTEYRLEARRTIRRAMIGGHIMRRLGQSLDFHDFTHYTPGDDIRHVDWRTSLRKNGVQALNNPDQWLIRRFLAEEQLTLFVSLDMRPSMLLPQIQPVPRGEVAPNISKLQMALWLAEALTRIAVPDHDKVIWHSLFGHRSVVSKIDHLDQAAAFYERVNREYGKYAVQPLPLGSDPNAPRPEEVLNQDGFDRFFPPAAVWLIITDFYFTDLAARQLAARVHQAQAGRRWVILVDLDSWSYERAILEEGFRQIDGPWSQTKKLNLDKQRLNEVEMQIAKHKRALFEMIPRADKTAWVYPTELRTSAQLQQFFEDAFQRDHDIRRLFMKDA